MNLEHLKIFYVTAKMKNYTNAAQVLNITQPSVTRLISEFQNNLGLVLINKKGKSFVLTAEGEVIFEMAKKIFEIQTNIEESVLDLKQQKAGNINILTTETYGAHYMPEFIVEYKNKFPKIMLNVTTLPDDHTIEITSRMECDFGIISNKINNPKLKIKELLREKIVFISSPKMKLANLRSIKPKELNNLPMIIFEDNCGTTDVVERFKQKNNLSFDEICMFSNSESVKSLVKKGLGYALISKNVVKNEVLRGELKSIDVIDDSLVRKFYIIMHKEKYISKNLKTFIDVMTSWSNEYIKSINL